MRGRAHLGSLVVSGFFLPLRGNQPARVAKGVSAPDREPGFSKDGGLITETLDVTKKEQQLAAE
jgi:hypothetical protein